MQIKTACSKSYDHSQIKEVQSLFCEKLHSYVILQHVFVIYQIMKSV